MSSSGGRVYAAPASHNENALSCRGKNVPFFINSKSHNSNILEAFTLTENFVLYIYIYIRLIQMIGL